MIQKVTGGLLGSRKSFEMGMRELRLMPAEKLMVAFDFVFVFQNITCLLDNGIEALGASESSKNSCR